MRLRTIQGALVASALATSGCNDHRYADLEERQGGFAGERRPSKEGCDSPVGDAARNDEIRLGLEEHCAGCHAAGSAGYFASLTAFQNLLVADPRLVVPGDPEASELVRLLEGDGSGSLPQMPLGMESFADLDERGVTAVTMQEIREWIEDLTVNGAPTDAPDYDAATVRKLSADHIEFGLRELLGLTRDDFFFDGSTYGVVVDVDRGREHYAVHSPTGVPGSFNSDPVSNYYSLGGSSTISGVAGDAAFTPPLIQVLVPLSQRWCTMAVAKDGNTALFTAASSATGSDDLDAVRQNIAAMHLQFLSVEPSDGAVEEILDDVFLPLEAETQDPAAAWAGVCSYLIRHPQFLLF